MKSRFLSLIKLFLGWPLAIVALFFIITFIYKNIKTASLALQHIKIQFIILSIFSFLVYFLLRVLLWKQILSFKGHSMEFFKTAYLWSKSEIKRFLPGGIWAFLGRTHAFARDDVKSITVFSAILIEAEAVCMGSLFVSFFAISFLHKIFFNIIWTGLIYIIAILALGIFLLGKIITKKLPKITHHSLPSFTIKQNVIILLISTFAMIFFAIGTYISILAITDLPLKGLPIFIGLFSFSFFAGYLAIFDPMGLGIREGAITLGLSKFITLPLAATASIFTRIILTISELIFLCISGLIYKLFTLKSRSHFKYKYQSSKFETNLNDKNTNNQNKTILNLIPGKFWKVKNIPWPMLILTFAILAYIVYFTTASFLRFTNYYTGRFDLGNMDQTVWNTIHGRIFQFTNSDGTNIISRLSVHADFLLILLAPFYLFWQDPRMLLAIQTIVLGCGAFFIYLIANRILKNKSLPLVFSIAYLINPSINHANLYDFHSVVLATTFLLAGFYFFIKRETKLFLLFLFLSAITKEEIWIVVILFGLLIFLKRNKILGSIMSLLGLVVFVFILFYAIPSIRGSQHFALSYYNQFGNSPISIVKNIVFSPFQTFKYIFSLSKIYYLFQLFLPVGFLSFLSPIFLIFLMPDLLINLLSSNNQFHQIYFQYTAVLTPFIFISAIYGAKKLLKIKIIIFIYIGIVSIVSAYFFGPLPFARYANIQMFTNPLAYGKVIDNFLQEIPQKYSIAATNNLGSHLSHREKIFTIPVGIDQADVILFLLNDTYAQPSLLGQKQMVEDMKKDKNYIEIFKLGDFIVFEKRNLYTVTEPNTDKIKLYPLSIPTLQNRDFVGGNIKIINEISKNKYFTKYNISFISDGLNLSGIMDIPLKDMPINGYPVVIVNSGYINSSLPIVKYDDRGVSDFFAKNGFLVIKPDYRNHGNSDKDPYLSFIPAYSIDVLNLIESISVLKNANYNNIFLWGEKIGGSITLSALEEHDQNKNFANKIKAASVWSPITDPFRGYSQMRTLFPKEKNIPFKRLYNLFGPYRTNRILWQSISPLYYLDDINTPLIISHGILDNVIPYHWSIELYNDLFSLNKSTKLFLYPGGDSLLTGFTDKALTQDLEFFKQHIN